MKEFIDQKSKNLFIVFFGFILLMVIISFYKYFIVKDYYIEVEIPCSPDVENCFVYKCLDSEGCTGEGDIYYYKLLKKKASAIPLCDPELSDCAAYDCSDGIDCFIINCNSQDEECSSDLY